MKRAATPWHERDTTPGFLLIAGAALSFALFNSPLAGAFDAVLHRQLIAPPFAAGVKLDVLHLVNDGLMAVFFLYVGLELKRECIEGPFRNPREAALPIIAALAGMAAPALVYLAIAGADAAHARGWAIPAATDIAFALGALALLGARVAPGLRLFLLALAIIDDLGAILVIAVFYTQSIAGWALGGALACFLAMLMLNHMGLKRLWLYWLIALALWAFMKLSGVHATVAGVLAALAIPMRRADGASPLLAAEHVLKPWVQLAIMPIFAIANAGLPLNNISLQSFLHPVSLGAGLGLVIGKPLGVFTATLGAAALLKRPSPGSPLQILGLSCIAGVGFTMSLFIGALAFADGPEAAPMRLGVIAGSLLSALIGLALLASSARRPGDPDLAREEQIAEEEGVLNAR